MLSFSLSILVTFKAEAWQFVGGILTFLFSMQFFDIPIFFLFCREGRASGECYIEVNSKEDQEEAVKKHRKNMGKRYVEGKSKLIIYVLYYRIREILQMREKEKCEPCISILKYAD